MSTNHEVRAFEPRGTIGELYRPRCKVRGCNALACFVAIWRQERGGYSNRQMQSYRCETHARAFARSHGVPFPEQASVTLVSVQAEGDPAAVGAVLGALAGKVGAP